MGPSLRVLIADDDANDDMSSSLRDWGHEPLLYRFEESLVPRYDIAFVAARASGSKELVRFSKRDNVGSPLVAIVDELEETAILSARTAGFDDVIISPLSANLVHAKIAMWCAEGVSPLVLDPGPIHELQKLRLEDGSGLVPALVKLFFASLAEIDRLRYAFSEGDLDAVRTIAHDLKSSCANLGVVRMKCVCHKIELSKEADDMRVALALLPNEFELAKIHLERVKTA